MRHMMEIHKPLLRQQNSLKSVITLNSCMTSRLQELSLFSLLDRREICDPKRWYLAQDYRSHSQNQPVPSSQLPCLTVMGPKVFWARLPCIPLLNPQNPLLETLPSILPAKNYHPDRSAYPFPEVSLGWDNAACGLERNGVSMRSEPEAKWLTQRLPDSLFRFLFLSFR